MDLVLVRNNTYAFDIAVIDNTGAIVNISAATFLCTAKLNYHDDDSIAIFKKTLANGIQILSGAAGTLRVTLAAVDTVNLAPHESKLYYDVKMILAGLPYQIVRGTLTVLANITNSIS